MYTENEAESLGEQTVVVVVTALNSIDTPVEPLESNYESIPVCVLGIIYLGDYTLAIS